MKFIFCDNHLGSVINFRGDVLEHFVQKGHQVILVMPQCTINSQTTSNIPKGCTCIGIDMVPSGLNPISDIKVLYQYYKIFLEEKPDVVFTYTIKPNIYGGLAASFARVKHRISMVAGLGFVFNGNGLVKKMARKLYASSLKRARRVITLNQENTDLLIKHHFVEKENTILFRCGEGVNLDKFPFTENSFDEHHFLMIARVLYDKGYAEFVDAAKMVKQVYPNVQFDLVGACDETSPMRVPTDVLEKDLKEGYINYLGKSNDVASLLARKGTVAVLPSYHEGMNRSLMEAAAMGRPIITSNIPGCKEIVDDKISGFLVEPRNANDLANKILEFCKLSNNEKEKMCIASYRKAKESFDSKLVIAAYEKILKDLYK